MESSTPLSLYLEKLAAGERDLAPIICQKLAQQMVYVPVCVGGKSKNEGKLIFQVVKLPEGNVPVFTTEQQYKAWAATNPEATEVFTVLGGDLCTTVGERATVVLDLGASHSSVLDQALMQLVSSAARESLIDEKNLRIDGNQPPKDETQAGASVSPPDSVTLETPPTLLPVLGATLVPEPEKIQPKLDPLRGRSNPTSIMPRPQRPRVDIDKDVHQKRLLGDGSKPVITTQDPDSAKLIRTKDDPKKAERRSLLKFLGG